MRDIEGVYVCGSQYQLTVGREMSLVTVRKYLARECRETITLYVMRWAILLRGVVINDACFMWT